MLTGYINSDGEWDDEILRSSDFQLISITIDITARYDSATRLPKGVLLTKDTDLSDGTYTVLETGSGGINGTPTQYMRDAVVLAETILDISLGDQPCKAYIAGTFDNDKIVYNNDSVTPITLAQWGQCADRIIVVDLDETA